MDRNMRIEINYDNLKHLLSKIFPADIGKTLCIHNFAIKNKNLMQC